MQKSVLEWTEEASIALDERAFDIAMAHDEAAAMTFLAHIDECTRRLESQPTLGKPHPVVPKVFVLVTSAGWQISYYVLPGRVLITSLSR
jgi:plasmid stabilization system protein ParE